MKLALLLPPGYDERKWSLARQAGVKYAITKASPELSGKPPPYDLKSLKAIKNSFEKNGFRLYGLEGDQFDMEKVKLGLPGRDETIERYQKMIRNMGELGIPLLCYNFMASVGWYRTRTDVNERGGAKTSEFNTADLENKTLPDEKRITSEKLWKNLFYFLDAVLPVAEASGIKMALHPDDPPVPSLMGSARILTSAGAFDRVLTRYNKNPIAGIAFCQATFSLMGENIRAISEKWLRQQKIFFIHLRDVEGYRDHFRETFHDNGPTDMTGMLKHYHKYGYDGPVRPDHAPAMHGETRQKFTGGLSAGYEMTGKILAAGYIRGICHAAGIPLK